MARIVWSKAEKITLFTTLELVYADDPLLDRKSALAKAQSMALPRDRWVKVDDKRVFNYKGQIEAARRNGMAIRKKRDATRETLVAQLAIPAPAPTPERKGSTTERLAGIFEQLLDVLADRVAERVLEKARPRMTFEEVREHVERQFEEELAKQPRPRHNPEPVSQPRQGRPGVLILGLLNQSGEQLRREYGDRFDIVWYDTDDAGKRTVHPMANVVLMTKFINHSIQNRWRKAGVLHYCNGGISELRQMLDKLSHG